jgi:ATP-dependent helicase HrpA
MAAAIAKTVERIHALVGEVERRLKSAPLHLLEDVAAQLGRLVHRGFATNAGARRLADIERYLKAILVRLETANRNPQRDADLMARVNVLEARSGDRPDVRWLLEELRVSVFAQQLGTKEKVSEQRIARLLE